MCAVTKVAKLSSWSLPQTINWHEHVHYKKNYPLHPPPPPRPDDYFDYVGIPQESDFRYFSDSNRLFLNPPVRCPPADWAHFVDLVIGTL